LFNNLLHVQEVSLDPRIIQAFYSAQGEILSFKQREKLMDDFAPIVGLHDVEVLSATDQTQFSPAQKDTEQGLYRLAMSLRDATTAVLHFVHHALPQLKFDKQDSELLQRMLILQCNSELLVKQLRTKNWCQSSKFPSFVTDTTFAKKQKPKLINDEIRKAFRDQTKARQDLLPQNKTKPFFAKQGSSSSQNNNSTRGRGRGQGGRFHNNSQRQSFPNSSFNKNNTNIYKTNDRTPGRDSRDNSN
jgi:hypothetical protein